MQVCSNIFRGIDEVTVKIMWISRAIDIYTGSQAQHVHLHMHAVMNAVSLIYI